MAMKVTPNIRFPEVFNPPPGPSLTYKLDIETGEITRRIDGREAIYQFILKTINTIRFNFVIYSDDYGCEIVTLFGKGFTDTFIEMEIIRMITESLIYDDRINRVYDFEVYPDGDAVYINFSVDTVEGVISIREVW